MKSLIVVLAPSLILAPALASAGECPGCPCDPAMPRVLLYDDQGNQVLVTSRMPALDPGDYTIDFASLDANGDGMLSRAELSRPQASSRATHNLMLEFHVADRNGDNWLSRDELAHWHGRGSGGDW